MTTQNICNSIILVLNFNYILWLSWFIKSYPYFIKVMSKTQIIVEGAIQQCKDEAAIQVSKWVMLIIRCVQWVQKTVLTFYLIN